MLVRLPQLALLSDSRVARQDTHFSAANVRASVSTPSRMSFWYSSSFTWPESKDWCHFLSNLILSLALFPAPCCYPSSLFLLRPCRGVAYTSFPCRVVAAIMPLLPEHVLACELELSSLLDGLGLRSFSFSFSLRFLSCSTSAVSLAVSSFCRLVSDFHIEVGDLHHLDGPVHNQSGQCTKWPGWQSGRAHPQVPMWRLQEIAFCLPLHAATSLTI